MDFSALAAMWQELWAFIYEVLKIFGIEKDEEGNLVEKEEAAE